MLRLALGLRLGLEFYSLGFRFYGLQLGLRIACGQGLGLWLTSFPTEVSTTLIVSVVKTSRSLVTPLHPLPTPTYLLVGEIRSLGLLVARCCTPKARVHVVKLS